jgi:hypothetical protein
MDLYDLAKDASWLEWSIITLVIIVLIVVPVYFLQRITTKICPFCRERIHPKAIVCRYCGKDLSK